MAPAPALGEWELQRLECSTAPARDSAHDSPGEFGTFAEDDQLGGRLVALRLAGDDESSSDESELQSLCNSPAGGLSSNAPSSPQRFVAVGAPVWWRRSPASPVNACGLAAGSPRPNPISADWPGGAHGGHQHGALTTVASHVEPPSPLSPLAWSAGGSPCPFLANGAFGSGRASSPGFAQASGSPRALSPIVALAVGAVPPRLGGSALRNGSAQSARESPNTGRPFSPAGLRRRGSGPPALGYAEDAGGARASIKVVERATRLSADRPPSRQRPPAESLFLSSAVASPMRAPAVASAGACADERQPQQQTLQQQPQPQPQQPPVCLGGGCGGARQEAQSSAPGETLARLAERELPAAVGAASAESAAAPPAPQQLPPQQQRGARPQTRGASELSTLLSPLGAQPRPTATVASGGLRGGGTEPLAMQPPSPLQPAPSTAHRALAALDGAAAAPPQAGGGSGCAAAGPLRSLEEHLNSRRIASATRLRRRSGLGEVSPPSSLGGFVSHPLASPRGAAVGARPLWIRAQPLDERGAGALGSPPSLSGSPQLHEHLSPQHGAGTGWPAGGDGGAPSWMVLERRRTALPAERCAPGAQGGARPGARAIATAMPAARGKQADGASTEFDARTFRQIAAEKAAADAARAGGGAAPVPRLAFGPNPTPAGLHAARACSSAQGARPPSQHGTEVFALRWKPTTTTAATAASTSAQHRAQHLAAAAGRASELGLHSRGGGGGGGGGAQRGSTAELDDARASASGSVVRRRAHSSGRRTKAEARLYGEEVSSLDEDFIAMFAPYGRVVSASAKRPAVARSSGPSVDLDEPSAYYDAGYEHA